MQPRTATAAVGLLLSLVVSVAAWYFFDTLLLFLFLPFVPILFRGRGSSSGRGSKGRVPVKESPRCGFRTRNPEFSHCPRDGIRLEEG